jgi:hypothetical protein
MAMSLLDVCQAIQNSAIGTSIRQSELVFPLIETAHVLALGLSVGTIMWFDLRLLGVSMRADPVSQVFGELKGWMLAGFAIMLTTGSLMFWALAADLYASRYFRIKLVLLVLAGLNILLYHATIDRRRYEWDLDPTPPLQARAAGFVSLLLWLGVIAAGRLTAYNV